jgi:hypothetical protein
MNNEELTKNTMLEAQHARVDFKSWPVHTQRRFLEGLLSEHAYLCGLTAHTFDVKGVEHAAYATDFAEGAEHRMDKNRGHE